MRTWTYYARTWFTGDAQRPRVSVHDQYEGRADLWCWEKGLVEPLLSQHTTVDEAKVAGETWLDQQGAL